VIDRARDALYVVVATMENGVAYTRLHAIGVGSGNELVSPTVISGSVALATDGTANISSAGNMNRAALLESNGNIYVALGSHCDQGTSHIHGWVVAYSAANLQETGNLVDLTNANSGANYFLGSPWMSGCGPASDALGSIYFATGNGPFDGKSNFSRSIMKVPGNLNLAGASFFAAIQADADSDSDADLGSGGVMLLPDQSGSAPHLLVAGGKCSANNLGCFKYVLNRDQLGGQQNNNAGAAWTANPGGDLFGGPAYFVDASGAQHVVLGGNPLNTYNLSVGPVRLGVQSSTAVGCLECRNGGGSQPVISSNGTAAGSIVVWALKTPGNSGGTISLYAFDALNMGTTLFCAPAGSWITVSGTGRMGGALISPLVANGQVYVPINGSVGVFGLLPETEIVDGPACLACSPRGDRRDALRRERCRRPRRVGGGGDGRDAGASERRGAGPAVAAAASAGRTGGAAIVARSAAGSPSVLRNDRGDCRQRHHAAAAQREAGHGRRDGGDRQRQLLRAAFRRQDRERRRLSGRHGVHGNAHLSDEQSRKFTGGPVVGALGSPRNMPRNKRVRARWNLAVRHLRADFGDVSD
jgi:hypothetical protein